MLEEFIKIRKFRSKHMSLNNISSILEILKKIQLNGYFTTQRVNIILQNSCYQNINCLFRFARTQLGIDFGPVLTKIFNEHSSIDDIFTWQYEYSQRSNEGISQKVPRKKFFMAYLWQKLLRENADENLLAMKTVIMTYDYNAGVITVTLNDNSKTANCGYDVFNYSQILGADPS